MVDFKELEKEVTHQAIMVDGLIPNWYRIIDIEGLEMNSGYFQHKLSCGCILAQLSCFQDRSGFGTFGGFRGELHKYSVAFHPPDSETSTEWGEVTYDAWVTEILRRRNDESHESKPSPL